MNLKNKVVLITGASERIGRSLALKVASLASNVAITYHIDKSEALKSVEMLKEYGIKAVAFKVDLNSSNEVEQLPKDVLKEFGQWDILINCASVFETVAIDDVDESRWNIDQNIHSRGPFFLSKALYLHKKEQNKKDGVVINITDTQVQKPKATRPSYNLAKAALDAQIKILAISLAPYVRVNGIAPGAIIPSAVTEVDYFNNLKEKLPLEKLATVEDVVETALFLIKNNSITGISVLVDSGEHLL